MSQTNSHFNIYNNSNDVAEGRISHIQKLQEAQAQAKPVEAPKPKTVEAPKPAAPAAPVSAPTGQAIPGTTTSLIAPATKGTPAAPAAPASAPIQENKSEKPATEQKQQAATQTE